MYGQIVPTMKSNSQDGFVVSASSVLGSRGESEPYKAFDQNNKTCWHSGDTYNAGWIKIKFPKPFLVDKIIEYTYEYSGAVDFHPNNWIIQCSMDDNTWQDLGQFTSSNKSYTKVEVKFEKTNMQYMRLKSTNGCLGCRTGYAEISGLEIYGYMSGNYSIKTSNKYIGGGEGI